MPTEALAYNTTYTCTVQDTAKDERGNRLENTTIWHYTTETVPPGRDWKDWVTYGALAFLIVMVVILYMANRSLRRDLKRTRVKLKRLKKQTGIEDEEPDISKDGQDGTPGGGEPAPEEAVSEAEGPENPDN